MKFPRLPRKTKESDLSPGIEAPPREPDNLSSPPVPEPENRHEPAIDHDQEPTSDQAPPIAEQTEADTASQEREKVDGPAPAAPPAPGGWFTPTRLVIGAAVLPSLLSLIWVATTVAEITGGPGGWAAGIFADVVIVSTVAVAWFNPDVRRVASIGGWVAAIAAGVLLGWHYLGTEQIAFALVPIGSKFLWHVALLARTAWERRRAAAVRTVNARAERARRETEEAAHAEAERTREREQALSTELTEDELRELASLRRQAAYARARAEAENELTTAEADADRLRQEAVAEAERIRRETEHRMRQEAIQRRVQEQMAVQQANADLLKQRQALELELQLTRPYAVGAASQARVPDDVSGLDDLGPDTAPVAGFGGVFGAGLTTANIHQGGGIGGNGADQAGHRPAVSVSAQGGGNGGIGADQAERSPHHAARISAGQAARQRVLDKIREVGVEVSTNELARLLDMGRTTVRDHRNALRDAGLRVYPDSE
ncbi:hypothetical protein AB0I72_11405 [Nocardiopsis sp. NPDC049922]|uniref:hypothetical protein n=1 Tax=Nocardiopsis sp. NPDC049922 TaxID=3155157 RepID=UPI00340ED4A7